MEAKKRVLRLSRLGGGTRVEEGLLEGLETTGLAGQTRSGWAGTKA